MHKIHQSFLQTVSLPQDAAFSLVEAKHLPLIGQTAAAAAYLIFFPFSELGANVNVINCSELQGRDYRRKTQLQLFVSRAILERVLNTQIIINVRHYYFMLLLWPISIVSC